VRIGTRGSALALVQARDVAQRLEQLGATVEIVAIRTEGDRLAQAALAEFGGKGLFVREIEAALLARRIDLAIHSLKDLPAKVPADLSLTAFLERADPRDLFITEAGVSLDDFPSGAVVGTSSLRRRIQLLHGRPDVLVQPIRGNVDTRLKKLRAGEYAGLIMARAGVARLGLLTPHMAILPESAFLPAPGQGIIAVEIRRDDGELAEFVSRIDHRDTHREAEAERSFMARLGANCHSVVAGLARAQGESISMTGWVSSSAGHTPLVASASGAIDASALGIQVADDLLRRGAGALLAVDASS
jgi:hydroxymethylbilane synthase